MNKEELDKFKLFIERELLPSTEKWIQKRRDNFRSSIRYAKDSKKIEEIYHRIRDKYGCEVLWINVRDRKDMEINNNIVVT